MNEALYVKPLPDAGLVGCAGLALVAVLAGATEDTGLVLGGGAALAEVGCTTGGAEVAGC